MSRPYIREIIVSRYPKPEWTACETRVRNTAVVQVTALPLRVPRYSFKVGTAQYDEQTQTPKIGPYLTVYNVQDAAILLKELGDKYVALREQKATEAGLNVPDSNDEDTNP